VSTIRWSWRKRRRHSVEGRWPHVSRHRTGTSNAMRARAHTYGEVRLQRPALQKSRLIYIYILLIARVVDCKSWTAPRTEPGTPNGVHTTHGFTAHLRASHTHDAPRPRGAPRGRAAARISDSYSTKIYLRRRALRLMKLLSLLIRRAYVRTQKTHIKSRSHRQRTCERGVHSAGIAIVGT
jgi:hypothetical protein